MSKIRESRGDRQLLVNAPYLSHPGDLCRMTGDGMLVEFASAVDAATSRPARSPCLRFCENDPSCDGCFFNLERTAKLLKSLGGAFSIFANAP